MAQNRKKIDIMERITGANKAAITGIDEKDVKGWVTIYILGKEYKVPAGLTMMQAMEYAGYRLVRSVGCRAGFCGACGTVYRLASSYKLMTGTACGTRVEDGMYLAQIPFTPGNKAIYNVAKEKYSGGVLLKHFPEITKCLACNTCTKACPQGIEVMDYVQMAKRGDFKQLAEISFDCIQCGLCALRCPAELTQYNIAQLGRRMFGRFGHKEPEFLGKRVNEINKGKFQKEMDKVVKAEAKDWVTMYAERDREED
jgi:formate hydrogenlyase subunit 6/NADH:ubiquinone oxidoreductase subunit I